MTVPLQLSANLSGTPIETLVVEVTAADIATPLAYNLRVVAGTASGTIQIPPGTARTITVRAFDADGTVTHDGSATVDVVRGNNPPVHIPLIPRSGHQPVDVTLAEVSVTVSPASQSLATGGSVQLVATVTAAGGVVDVVVGWATLNPAVVSVSAGGLVTALSGGTASVVATYAGVGAAATISVLTGGETTWYADADGDGYGNPGVSVLAAIGPSGYVADGSDCNDGNASTHPGAPEILDGEDNDCDGLTDAESGWTLWYTDADGDGYGNPSSGVFAPEAPTGYVAIGGDCNDSDASTHPGAVEITGDGVDSDCDGVD